MSRSLKADQVAAAFIVAPGEVISITEGQRETTLSLPVGSYAVAAPVSGSFSFTVAQAGKYLARHSLAVLCPSGENASAKFKLVFDEGTADEQTVGDTNDWTVRVDSSGSYAWPTMEATVELTASAHTLKVYGTTLTGPTGGVRLIGSSAAILPGPIVWLTAVTGSGAGGILASREGTGSTLVDTDYVSPWTPLELSDLTQTVTVAEGEQVQVLFGGHGQQTGAGSTTMYVYLFVDDAGTASGNAASYTRNSGWADWERGDLSFSYLTEPLTAGNHTFRIYIAKTSSPEANWTLVAPFLHLVQYRGGLVPIKQDGTLVQDKPQAINFINAEVVDDNGEVDITLPRAVTAPGDFIELCDGPPSSQIDIGSGDTLIAPQSGSFSFVAKQAGVFKVQVMAPYVSAGSATSTETKVVFDEGAANEQTVGYGEQWVARISTNVYSYPTFTGLVTLTAGTHTVKVYGKETSGTAAAIATGADAPTVKITLEPLTGSGAGGEIISKKTTTTALTNTTTSYLVEDELTTTFIAVQDEPVTLLFTGTVSSSVINTSVVGYRIDGGAWVDVIRNGQAAAYVQNASWTTVLTNLSAGSHTVEIGMRQDTTPVGTMTLRTGSSLIVKQARGGLVPIKQDGTLVQDKPQAINLLGPGLQATNVGGQVNVSVQSAAEGLDVLKTAMVDGPTDLTVATETVVASLDVTVAEGETVLVSFVGTARSDTPGQNVYTSFRIRDGGLAGPQICQMVLQPFNSGSDNQNASFTYPVVGLSAGAHTLVVTASPSNTYLQLYYYQMAIMRFRGGYVQPENIPILAYSSASVINVQAAPGAASRLWAVLNDGKRRYADAPLTIDLTGSGEGGLDTGSEASSTWYYCYLVPDSTDDGQLNVVCSVTDPDSGGPTGYNAWKYLGAVRNDGSSDIIPFRQDGAQFTYEDPPSYSQTVVARTHKDVSAFVPATATLATLYIQASFSGTWTTATIYPSSTTTNACAYCISWESPLNTLNAEVPIYGSPRGYEHRVEGGGTCLFRFLSWADGHLSAAPQSQTQAKYLPDTKSPQGTWATETTVNFAARPGQPSTTRLTLQDGKQRTSTGTLAWAVANGVADLGYDEAGSQGNSKWLYFYAVPKSGDDNQFTIRASDNPPTTGPAGYTNWKMVWSTYIDGSGNLLKVYQQGDRFYREAILQVLNTSGGPGTKTTLALSSAIPLTATAALLKAYAATGGASGVLDLFIDGATSRYEWVYPSSVNDSSSFEMPTPTSPKQIQYQINGASLAAAIVETSGWIDEWIDS
jgi:hypothetical protein